MIASKPLDYPPPRRLVPGRRRWLGSNRKIGWTLFALALALRLGWSLFLQNHLHLPDEEDFSSIAQHLVQGHGYVSRSFRANPTLPFYLALLYRTVGENYVVGRIGQCLIGAASCLLIWRLTVRLAGREAGAVAGLLAAIYPPHIAVCGFFYVDCLLDFFLTLAIYLAIRVAVDMQRTPGKTGGGALLTGIALGLTALTRPIFLVAIPCVAIAWLLRRASLSPVRRGEGRGEGPLSKSPLTPPSPLRTGERGINRKILLCGLMVLGAAAVIVPWTVRNQRRYDRFILVSTGLGTKLWQGNNELADGSAFDRELYWNNWDQDGHDGPESWNARLSRLDPAQQKSIKTKYAGVEINVKARLAALNWAGYEDDRELAADNVLEPIALDWMKGHPGRVTILFFKRLATLYSAWSPTIWDKSQEMSGAKMIATVSFYPVLVLALVGMMLMWRKRRDFAVLYLLIASVSGAYSLLNACTRFRWPLDRFLIVFAAVAVVFLFDKFVKRTT